MTDEKRKDGWDKADIIGKLISGVLLGVLAVVLKLGADKIHESADLVASALRKGEFVQKLVSDISQPTDKVRRDVSLIALNRSVGQEDTPLVLEIVEHVFKNSPKEPEGELTRSVAFRIIEERNPERAQAIKDELLSAASSDEEGVRETLRSAPALTSQPEKPKTEQSLQISAAFPKIVYIQYLDPGTENLVRELRSTLNRTYPVPGIERVNGEYKNGVRYFHKGDRALAATVVEQVRQFLQAKGCPTNFELQDLGSSKLNVQKGQIEVWLAITCP